MNFRNELKKALGHKLFDIEVETKEQEIIRTELGLRLLQFFKYEQDPEFSKMFNSFLIKRNKMEKMQEQELER